MHAMLDTLLGRAGLKERINELEQELASCQEELDRMDSKHTAADRRRREAIREAQVAQEERSRLEDRIEQLTDELDRVREGHEVSYRGRHRLDRGTMATVLALLESVETEPEELFTGMVTDGGTTAITEHFGDRRALVSGAAPSLCLFDSQGLIEIAMDPPLPPAPFEHWGDEFRLERSWFLPTDSFPFAVVRADLFAMGRFDGETLGYLDGFESEVMGRHSKGGFSQARFERRREEQIDQHLDRCRRHLGSVDTDRLILAGSREALDRLAIDSRLHVPVDASGSPRSALETAFEEVWTTTMYRL